MTDLAHIVALSGGADSTAMALAMAERGAHIDHFLCTPTKNELPEMSAHWDRLDRLLPMPLTRVVKHGLADLILAQSCLPNARMRWCTRMLKIEPAIAFMAKRVSEGRKPVIYVGLRADEEERQGLYHSEIETRFPMRDWGWSRADVEAYLDERGVVIPPRTDCAWCYDQQLIEWWNLWRFNPDIYAEGERLESVVSEARGYPCTFRSATRDSWPAGLADLRVEFEKGRVPTPSKRQLPLFSASVAPRVGGRCRVCSL